MSVYLNTTGLSKIAIAICDRCKMKRPYVHLISDVNAPGLRVCKDTCADLKDPWLLPPRQTEDISLQYPRPDEPLTVGDE